MENEEPRLSPASVPRGYLRSLREVRTRLVDPDGFVDVAAPATHTALNKHGQVRHALSASGLGEKGKPVELDEGTVRLGGPRGRKITQIISRLIYEETDAAGIRYTSRLDAKEPCWAVFDWVRVTFSKETPVQPQDAALRSAALTLGLTLP